MSEKRHYFVYLRREFIESADKLKSLVAKHDNFISCTSIDHLPYYLDMEVPYHDPVSDETKTLRLLIPHSEISYVLNPSEKDLNKILGFCSQEE